MIFKNFVDQDWIGFNFIRSGLDSDWKILQSPHLCNSLQSLSVLEAFNGIASCKIFCPSFKFHHFTMNCSLLMLFFHELKQVLVLVRNAENKVVYLTRCETQDLCNTDTSDINESQSWSLPLLKFLSADLTWRKTIQPQQMMLLTSQYYELTQ